MSLSQWGAALTGAAALLLTACTVVDLDVGLVYGQIESAGDVPAHHQRRLKHHINRMWLENMPVPSIVVAARSLAAAMEEYA
jgi:hypothetical protein